MSDINAGQGDRTHIGPSMNAPMSMVGPTKTEPTASQESIASSFAFPIRPLRCPEINSEMRRRIESLAVEITAAEPKIGDIEAFGTGVVKGCGDGPGVWFGDTAEIPLMARNPGKRFDYRLAWLAGPEDIVVIGGPSCPSFEKYQRRWLKSPRLKYLNVDPTSTVPRRATVAVSLRDENAYAQLRAALGNHGATLNANLTTGTVWALASRLSTDTGRLIHVAGPPPLLSRRANNKLWFGEITQRLLGTGATPSKCAAYSASSLSRNVYELARKWDRLVVKAPDSAGSEGNFALQTKDIRGLSMTLLKDRLLQELTVNGIGPRFPMLVEVWDANVLSSPSVQTWIPDTADGPPVIEGIFEQLLSGENAAFTGAALARVTPTVADTLCRDAMQLALLFQRLGYFGRCSFDTLITGPGSGLSASHWIECNARWGGVSIPMSLVNRLSRPDTSVQYVIVQNDNDTYRRLPFDDALREFADSAPPTDLSYGVLFLSPNLMETGLGCHFLAFGADAAAAAVQANAVLGRL